MFFVLGIIAWFNKSGIFMLTKSIAQKSNRAKTPLIQEGHDGPGPLTWDPLTGLRVNYFLTIALWSIEIKISIAQMKFE